MGLDESCRELLAALPDGLVLVEQGHITYVNHEIERMTGHRVADLVGAPLETLVPDQAAGRHVERRRGFEAAPRARSMGHDLLLTMRRADGTELPVEIALAPLHLDGRVGTLASVRDVTLRRRREAERRRLVEILDLVPDSIIVAEERTGRVLAKNQAATRLLGREALLAEGTGWGHVPPPGERHARAMTLTAGDGSAVECEVQSTVVTVHGGGRVVVNVVRDVGDVLALRTRLRRTEESFRTAFEQAPVGIAVTRTDDTGRREFVHTNSVRGPASLPIAV